MPLYPAPGLIRGVGVSEAFSYHIFGVLHKGLGSLYSYRILYAPFRSADICLPKPATYLKGLLYTSKATGRFPPLTSFLTSCYKASPASVETKYDPAHRSEDIPAQVSYEEHRFSAVKTTPKHIHKAIGSAGKGR